VADFSVVRDSYSAPQIVCNPTATDVLNLHRIASISISLTHSRQSASAVALALPMRMEVSLAGKLLYRILPYRRRIVQENCNAYSTRR
jgi:hypothetical protein